MTDALSPTDDAVRLLLSRVATIAVVGYSAKPSRPSHTVSSFLSDLGYRVIPVNPGLAGQVFLGEVVQPSLAEINTPIDMVDVFRQSQVVPEIVDEMLQMFPRPSVLWTQLGVRHDAAADTARAAGLTVVQDRCPRIEIPRLFPADWRRA
ncbi:MAG: CoA-binding protein [Pseudomonadota bacterium]